MLDAGGAVPDVSLARTGPDLKLQLAYPLGPSREPAKSTDRPIDEHDEAPTPAREPQPDEVVLVAHRGFDEVRARGVDLLNRKKRRTRRRQVRRPESASNQKRKWRRLIVLITSSSPDAEPPGNLWKNVSTASAALLKWISASHPSKLPLSGCADQAPSLTVARHLPPHGPSTWMPYVKTWSVATFSSTVYCQNTKANGRIRPAVASSMVSSFWASFLSRSSASSRESLRNSSAWSLSVSPITGRPSAVPSFPARAASQFLK